MDPVAALLLAWIATNTTYDVDTLPLPTIQHMSAKELTREYYGAVPHLIPENGIDDRLNALYSAEDGMNGTIFILNAELVDDASHFEDPRDNPIYREILLHELIHHVQWQNGEPEKWDCQSYGEREAYILGGRYLKQTHTTDPLPNRMFWAHAYARC